MATLYNQGHHQFKWRKQLRSRCLIEEQQISFIVATVATTRHHPIVLFPRRIEQVVQVNRKQRPAILGRVLKIQRIRHGLGVSYLSVLENQDENKHVESSLVPRLDEGSNPSSSTWRGGQIPDLARQNQDKPQTINQFCGFLVPKNFDSGPKSDRKKTATDRLQLPIRYTKSDLTKNVTICNEIGLKYLCSS